MARRVYKNKGPDAKTRRITIPVTERMIEEIAIYAAEIGDTKTVAARMLLSIGLELRIPSQEQMK